LDKIAIKTPSKVMLTRFKFTKNHKNSIKIMLVTYHPMNKSPQFSRSRSWWKVQEIKFGEFHAGNLAMVVEKSPLMPLIIIYHQ